MLVDFKQVQEDYKKKDEQIQSLQKEIVILNEFCDLWHFVMDKASKEFEEIVHSCDSKIWMKEALKLKREMKS